MRMFGTWLSMLMSLLIVGCGTIDPAASNSDTEPVATSDGDVDGGADTDYLNDYYPMAVGDFWTYREEEPDFFVHVAEKLHPEED